jgi:hypothetical protein
LFAEGWADSTISGYCNTADNIGSMIVFPVLGFARTSPLLSAQVPVESEETSPVHTHH